MQNTIHKPTQRVLSILLLVASEDKGYTLSQISEFTNIPKGTISPILKTLVQMKFLSIDNNKYTIGINSFKVGESFLKSSSVLDIIKSYMQNIVKECNEICQLGVLQDNEVLYLIKEEPYQSIKLESSVGKKLPAYSTALGKSLLTKYTNDDIRLIFKNNMIPTTKNTITNIDDLISSIEFARKHGYSYEKGESAEGVECIAVPISHKNNIVAAISISIPLFRSNHNTIKDFSQILIKYKHIIESEISGLSIDF